MTYAASTAYLALGGADSGAIPFDNTRPQSNEGVEILNVAHSPGSGAGGVDVEALVYANAEVPSVDGACVVALFRDQESDACAAAVAFPRTTGGAVQPVTLRYRHTGSTAHTWRIRVGPRHADGMLYINGNAAGQRLGGCLASSLSVRDVPLGE